MKWASIALVLLLAASSAQANWLQAGYDEANTGATPELGPKLHEVAMVVQLPGTRVPNAPPIIVDNAAFIFLEPGMYSPTQGIDEQPPEHTQRGIVRVDLDSGNVSTVVETEALGTGEAAASDGERLYVQGEVGVQAFWLSNGSAAWEAIWVAPEVTQERHFSACAQMAISEGSLYVSCNNYGRANDTLAPGPLGGLTEDLRWAARLDVVTGQPEWLRFWEDPLLSDASEVSDESPIQAHGRAGIGAPQSISVIDDYVHITQEFTREAPCEGEVHVLRAADGAPHWRWPDEPQVPDASAPPPQTGGTSSDFCPTPDFVAPVTGAGPIAYYNRAGILVEVNAATMQVNWNLDLGGKDAVAHDSGGGLATDGESIWAASYSAIHRIDPDAEDIVRSSPPLTSDQSFSLHGLVLADGVIYARAASDSGDVVEGYVHAYDAESLEPLWSHRMVDSVYDDYRLNFRYAFGISDGLAVISGYDGSLTVLGRTEGSIVPMLDVSSTYPAAGDEIKVDLRGTLAGIGGAATEFRAVWDDGTVTDWQASPVLTHVYEQEKEWIATVYARNDAGQMSAQEVTFNVGEDAPTLLSTMFARDNQDMSWGVIGLVVVVLGAGWGALRLQRNRRRMRKEVAAIESAAENAATGSAHERAMQERREHAKLLLLAGKIDESQLRVLQGRIEELARGHRLAAIDERFDFLPYGMVRRLRGMLDDGRITSWEHEHFVEALRGDPALTAAQKTRVRSLIDAWFSQDAGKAS
jgi:hypothetical protein